MFHPTSLKVKAGLDRHMGQQRRRAAHGDQPHRAVSLRALDTNDSFSFKFEIGREVPLHVLHSSPDDWDHCSGVSGVRPPRFIGSLAWGAAVVGSSGLRAVLAGPYRVRGSQAL